MLQALPRNLERMLSSPRGTFAMTALLTLAAAVLGLRLQEDGISVFWPAAGVGAGLMLIVPARNRWSVAAGMLLALSIGNFMQRRSIPASLVFVAGNIAQSWLAAILLERFAGRPFELERTRGVVAFIAIAIATPAVIGGLTGPGLYLSAYLSGTASDAWRIWAASHAVGILTFAPAVLLLGRARWDKLGAGDLTQVLAVAALALVVIGSFGPGTSTAVLVAVTFVLPVIIWVLLGAGLPRAASAVLVIAAITIWQTSGDTGLFAAHVEGAQLFLALTSAGLLLLGSWRRSPVRAWSGRMFIRGTDQMRAAAALVPLLLFIAVAWWSWQVTERDAFARANRLSHALAEHAQRIIESQQTAVEAALAHVRGRTPAELEGDPRVQQFLSRLAGATGMVEAIRLVALADGRTLSASKTTTTPTASMADRDFITAFARGASGTYIGKGEGDRDRLAFSISRYDSENGIVAVAQPPLDDLIEFYKSLREGKADALSLIREDGEIFARVPGPEKYVGGKLDPAAPLFKWFRGELTGPAAVRSSIDGRIRIARARKVADYPVFVYYGLDYSEVRATWLRQIAPFAALSLLGSALIAIGLRQARRAEIAKASAELDTERARLELESANVLLASEERYRLLVEQADDGLFVADAAGRYTDVNPAGCRMLGYTRAELLRLSIADIISPEETARIAPEVARFAGGAVARSEWRFLRKDGSIFIGEVVGRQLEDGRLQAFVRDITDRKQVEETLRETARQAEELALTRLRLASIVDSTDDAVMSFDTDGRVTSWNKGAERLFGFTEAEAFARDAALLVAPLGSSLPGEGPRGAFDQALRGEPFQHDTIRVAKDGTLVDVSVTANQLRAPDGRVLGVSAIMRDIRDRKRAELKLRESQQSLQAALDISNVAPWGWDEIKRVKLWTDRTKAIFGLPPEADMTRDLFVSLLHPEDVPRYHTAWASALDPAGRRIYELQYRIRRADDGAERWITSRASVEFDGDHPVRVVGALRDFTDEKLAEEALRRSEARYRLLHESLRDGFVEVDMQGRVINFNELYREMLGYDADELKRLTYVDLTPERWHASEATIVEREVLTRDYSDVYEKEYRRKDGAVIAIELRTILTRDASGQPAAMWALVRDITARKTTEAALRESEERLRLTNESAGIGTFLIDVATRTARYSPELAQMLGFPGVLKVPLELALARVHRDDQSRVRTLYEAAHDPSGDGRLRMEFRFVRPGGEVRWMTWNGKVEFRDGRDGPRPVRLLGACVDITDRKHAEQQLMTSEERLRAIVDTAVDAIIVSDDRGIIESVNPAAEQMFGCTQSDLVGGNVSMLMAEPDRGAHDGYLAGYVRTGEARIIGRGRREVLALRRDGSTFQADLAVVEWYASGKRYFTGILRDITERKRSERQIRHLLAEVNHRAKNLLGVVQAIALQTAASNPADFIERFSDRIQGLAASQDLLVQSRWQGIELDALVRSQLSHFSDLIGSRIMVDGPPVRVSASAAQTIGMALHELATNAGKYGALSTSAGRVSIAWNVGSGGSEPDRFTMSWTERGGPPVDRPSRRGFGSTVIESMPKLSLNASVSLRYEREGLSWSCTCPYSAVLEGTSLVTGPEG